MHEKIYTLKNGLKSLNSASMACLSVDFEKKNFFLIKCGTHHEAANCIVKSIL